MSDAPIRHLDMLVHETADAIIAVSPAGRVLFWSRGAATMFGYTSEEAVGHLLTDLTVPPDRRVEEVAWQQAALETGRAIFETVRHRKRRLTPVCRRLDHRRPRRPRRR